MIDIALANQDGEAYTHLLNVLAPEHSNPATLEAKDPFERMELVLDHAEKIDCKRYLSPKDVVEGSTNLNIAFIAQIFHQRWQNFTCNYYTLIVTASCEGKQLLKSKSATFFFIFQQSMLSLGTPFLLEQFCLRFYPSHILGHSGV